MAPDGLSGMRENRPRPLAALLRTASLLCVRCQCRHHCDTRKHTAHSANAHSTCSTQKSHWPLAASNGSMNGAPNGSHPNTRATGMSEVASTDTSLIMRMFGICANATNSIMTTT